MAGVNRVILIGNLGKDQEVMTLDNGVKFANITVATNESYKDKEGNWVEQTEWHRVVLWRWLTEKNLIKGDQVYIEGKLRTRSWDDKDGNKRYTTEVVAEKIIRISSRRDQQGGYNNPPPPTQPDYIHKPSSDTNNTTQVSQNTPEVESSAGDAPSDDLPF